MNYQECYEEGCSTLTKAGIEEAALDARLLLEYVCGTTRNDLLVHGDNTVMEQELSSYRELIAKRADRIPLQHITGVQAFMGLEFKVNSKVLIPRQDTEILVEEVLKELHDGMRILDMCTGSGCILLSLLYYSNRCVGVGVDISEEALKVAHQNAQRILEEQGKNPLRQCWESDESYIEDATAEPKAVFWRSDLFEQVEGRFDRIVSNPPYIVTQEIAALMPEVRVHEPLLALDGKEDGLFFYRIIIAQSPEFLVRGGSLYLEIGCDQANAVVRLMEEAGFREIKVVKDYAGLDRVVSGTFVE